MVGLRLYSYGGVSNSMVSVCPEEFVINSSSGDSGMPVYEMEMRAFSMGRELPREETFTCSLPRSTLFESIGLPQKI